MTRIVFIHTAGMHLPPEKKSGTDLAVGNIFAEIQGRWDAVSVEIPGSTVPRLQRHWMAVREGAPSVIINRLNGSPEPQSILRAGDTVVLADDYAGLLLGRGWGRAVLIRHNAIHHSYAKTARTTFGSHLSLGYNTWLARRFDKWTTRAAKMVIAPAGTTELLLKKLVPEGRIHPWHPQIPRLESGPLEPAPGSKLRGLYFANFKYEPNFESLQYLCHVLGPALAGTNTVIRVCGPWSHERAAELNVPPNVEICGFQSDLVAFARECDFGVVPIFRGEGILLKTLTLMGYGLPMVATSLACAGTGVRDGVDAFIADDVGSMVAAIERLQDPKVRREMGRSAWNAAEPFSNRSGILDAIQASMEQTD